MKSVRLSALKAGHVIRPPWPVRTSSGWNVCVSQTITFASSPDGHEQPPVRRHGVVLNVADMACCADRLLARAEVDEDDAAGSRPKRCDSAVRRNRGDTVLHAHGGDGTAASRRHDETRHRYVSRSVATASTAPVLDQVGALDPARARAEPVDSTRRFGDPTRSTHASVGSP